MTTTHNQGRLRVGAESSTLISDTDGPGVRGYDHPSYGGYLVAESIHPTNAPRLAACWNACHGIPTDALQKVEGDTAPVFQLLMDTWAERERLQALLNRVTQDSEWSCMDRYLQDDIERALGIAEIQVAPAEPPTPPPICATECDYQQDSKGSWTCTRCGDWLPF